jgi:hypothetical protein
MKTRMMWTFKKSFWVFLMLSMVTLLSAGVVEFPLIQSMSYFPYAEHSLLDRSDMSVHLGLYYSNVYMFERNGEVTPVINDFEVSSPTLEFRYGLVKGVTLEVFYRISSVFGGELDRLIENFHDSFNLPDNQRPTYPRNAVHYKYRDYFQYYQRKNFVSPLVFSCLAGIVDRPGFSIKSRLALGIPLAEMPGFVSAKPFLTTGLIMGFGGEKFSLDMSAYLSFFKQPLWLEDVDMSSQIFLTDIRLGLGRFLAGFVYRTSPFKEGDIAHDARQLYVGYRFGNSVELILFEDLAPFDTSPDISVSLRFKLL